MAEEAERIGQEIAKRNFSKEKSPEFETWDNTGFRGRLYDIIESAELRHVDLDKVVFPEEGQAKFQYRRVRGTFRGPYGDPHYDEDSNLQHLRDSILQKGLLRQIYLQKKGEDYYIIDGHSRFQALKMALEEDPGIQVPKFLVLEISDADAAQIAVELNRYAENLDDEDRYALVIRLYEEAGIMQKDIAEQLGWSEGYISEIIAAFRDVPAEAREVIEKREWSVKHGRELAKLKHTEKEQLRLLRLCKQYSWNASQLEEKVDKVLAKEKWEKLAKAKLAEVAPEKETLSEQEAAKIHKKVRDDVTTRKMSYSGQDKHVVKYGEGEYEPTETATSRLLKDMGYDISEEAEDEEEEKDEGPQMPSDSELLEYDVNLMVCRTCGGRIDPMVAEELDIECSASNYYQGQHEYCAKLTRVKSLQLQLDAAEKSLQEDPLFKRFDSGEETLESLNEKAQQIYEQMIEETRKAWAEEHGIDYDTDEKEEDDIFARFARLVDEQPDLVEPEYAEAYQRYLEGEPGYESQREICETLDVSKGTVYRRFKTISEALEE